MDFSNDDLNNRDYLDFEPRSERSEYSDQIDSDIEQRLYSFIHHDVSGDQTSHLNGPVNCTENGDHFNPSSVDSSSRHLKSSHSSSTPKQQTENDRVVARDEDQESKSKAIIASTAQNSFRSLNCSPIKLNQPKRFISSYYQNHRNRVETKFHSQNNNIYMDFDVRKPCLKQFLYDSNDTNDVSVISKQFTPEVITISDSEEESEASSDFSDSDQFDSSEQEQSFSSSSSTDSSDSQDEYLCKNSNDINTPNLKLTNVIDGNENTTTSSSSIKRYLESESESEEFICNDLSVELLDSIPGDGRRFKRIKRNPGEDPSLWKIDVKDLAYNYNIHTDVSRYYKDLRNSNKWCDHCEKYGNHPTALCNAKQAIVCLICGQNGHRIGLCKIKLCTQCFQFGHTKKQCRLNVKSLQCEICKMKGHQSTTCPYHWRKYSNTTEINSSNTNNIELQLPKIRRRKDRSCSHCAGYHYIFKCKNKLWDNFHSPCYDSNTYKTVKEKRRKKKEEIANEHKLEANVDFSEGKNAINSVVLDVKIEKLENENDFTSNQNINVATDKMNKTEKMKRKVTKKRSDIFNQAMHNHSQINRGISRNSPKNCLSHLTECSKKKMQVPLSKAKKKRIKRSQKNFQRNLKLYMNLAD
ncbi:hypothetical protein B4U79_16146 [Dinothrombium tinctorium]|uniref:Zinc finger CCHC domain-containing protein 7 n=1 Tax=Dinothrombium tinctorium TaxID=1965070 RepID=A0A443QW20_9ACAR|nr:hypothetical protein B4U79_16146 [Dinothrombium tinctorium]